MADPGATGDTEEPQDFKLTLADLRFAYRTKSLEPKEKAKLQQEMLDIIFHQEAALLYEEVSVELGWPVDDKQLAVLREANEKHMAALAERLKDAEENLGDAEVLDACLARADFLAKTGDAEAAKEAYRVTETKMAGAGQKLDLAFSVLRLDIAAGKWHEVKAGLKKAKELCEEGGDWERKNRLKVYEALFLVATRSIKQAADLFLDSIATFTSSELFSYERCIFYTVVTSLVSLDRVALKEKVIDSPEVLSVIDSIPHLTPFVNSLYDCDYRAFFAAFAAISDDLRYDRYLHPHFRFYVREVRAVAYAQFLESYKSVMLSSMAGAFGVSAEFMDAELADFIVAGRLTAKIDKVAGVIETNRPDAKNAQYQQTIKQGDLLLNRLQKLSKVIDVE